jgi:hypothetical protein
MVHLRTSGRAPALQERESRLDPLYKEVGACKMAVERAAAAASLIDVLDRVLDKGIVIDAWVRVSLVGIDLITVEARLTVASIDTYLRYADLLTHAGQPRDRLVLENRVSLAPTPRSAKARGRALGSES